MQLEKCFSGKLEETDNAIKHGIPNSKSCYQFLHEAQ